MLAVTFNVPVSVRRKQTPEEKKKDQEELAFRDAYSKLLREMTKVAFESISKKAKRTRIIILILCSAVSLGVGFLIGKYI